MANLNLPPLLLFLLLLSLPISPLAEIKTLTITSDSRPVILFEVFGFDAHGSVIIDVSEASFASSVAAPNPSLIGFFLLSQDNLIQFLYDSQQPSPNPNPNPNPKTSSHPCILSSPYVRPLFTFRDLSPPPFNSFNASFSVALPGEYSLFLANCAPDTEVSMAVQTEMFNSRPGGSRDYLSAGQSPLPSLYFLFALFYFSFFGIWTYHFRFKNRFFSHRIHYLMAGLLLAKSLNLIFAAEEQHNIKTTGTPHGWDVPFYFFQCVKGLLLFTVIVLVGTGWSFLKPFLQEREKKVLMIVIPLQVMANVASVVIGETGPFIKDWGFWKQVFFLIDIVCCFAIIVPIVWSIRALRETSKTDGKAARNLAKLTLFRQFYILLVGYLYFTRIVVFALKTIAAYNYWWVSVAADEAVTLAFYIFMFYIFRPKERNGYFVLGEEDEEAAQAALREEEFEL